MTDGVTDETILAPFRLSLQQLRQSHDGIEGWAVPKPRLIHLGKHHHSRPTEIQGDIGDYE